MKHAVKKSQRIIAVSEFTASELEREYGSEIRKKVAVIPEAVSSVFQPQTKEQAAEALERYGVSMPFYLYVGNAKEHKNLPLLLDAFEKLQDSEASLVLVSGGKELSRHVLPPHTHVLSDVSDRDLASLYSLARAVVSPSLYEGFGLPIAEAAACGCPVIAVKGSAVSEVSPPSAQLIEPSMDALVAAMKNLKEHAVPSPGRNWDSVARATLNVLLSS